MSPLDSPLLLAVHNTAAQNTAACCGEVLWSIWCQVSPVSPLNSPLLLAVYNTAAHSSCAEYSCMLW
jgi:hypothetical protein